MHFSSWSHSTPAKASTMNAVSQLSENALFVDVAAPSTSVTVAWV